MTRLNADAFREFCSRLMIPSKDHGLVPLTLWGTQTHWIDSVEAGLERGVHDFVTLKGGRQIGGSTVADAMALWWPQVNQGTQGMLVSDDDDNRDYRRDLLLEMNASLPIGYRLPMRLNNRILGAWPNGSRLSFRSAGKRTGSNLGRSRGVSFLHADEVGSWPDQQAIMSLRAALSERNPLRLYLWNSTAQGIDTPFHALWKTAEQSHTTRAIFVAWWRHEGYELDPANADLWGAYADRPPTYEEAVWMREVERRYDAIITAAKLGWWRWKLREQFFGDETMMSQEFASLPEEAFQAFGDKFISPRVIRRMRMALIEYPRPVEGYEYEFHDTLDETAAQGITRADPATAALRVWEEPQPDGVYVVAGHPAYSSSEFARDFVCEVFRVWPDRMVQVAEYCADQGVMYQFAWVCLHLAGAYRTWHPTYFILEVAGGGNAALAQIQLLERHGYGLTPAARGKVQDLMGSIQHYFYSRPDAPFRRPHAQEWHTRQGSTRQWLLHALQDTVERQQLEVRAMELVDNLAALRRGEAGDQDRVAAGAEQSDSRAMCTALAVECWLRTAMPELQGLMFPQEPARGEATTVQQRLVQSYLPMYLRGEI